MGIKLINVVKSKFNCGIAFVLPIHIAKNGKEIANTIIPILLDIENIIVKKGL